jgi:hypothetical protein
MESEELRIHVHAPTPTMQIDEIVEELVHFLSIARTLHCDGAELRQTALVVTNPAAEAGCLSAPGNLPRLGEVHEWTDSGRRLLQKCPPFVNPAFIRLRLGESARIVARWIARHLPTPAEFHDALTERGNN